MNEEIITEWNQIKSGDIIFWKLDDSLIDVILIEEMQKELDFDFCIASTRFSRLGRGQGIWLCYGLSISKPSHNWKCIVVDQKDLILYSYLPFKHIKYFELLEVK
jgi:hypothetical protein